MDNILPSWGEEWKPDLTNVRCPNGCDEYLVEWWEQNGPDDVTKVMYCKSCEERFEE